ncbi:MAG: ABC transporter permease [Candidatus Cloacimonetes bacterium]|nr:ABC transporter permease [Candidatus Cloacimonadota bacterium]
MFKNYLKIAFRKLIRQKVFSFINLFGLAVGMTACLLILFWIRAEFSFDRYNENFDSIYRVIHQQNFEEQTIHSSKAPIPLGPALAEDFPEVINFARYGTFVGEVLIEFEDKAFYELGGAYVDPSWFDIFTVDFLQGDKTAIFPDRFSVIITESTAKKYFGDENPIGKTLELENVCELTISAIIKDIPQNAHLKFDFAVPFTLYEAWGEDLNKWDSWPTYTYLQLIPGVSKHDLDAKIADYLHDKIAHNHDKIYLQPLSKIHLYSRFAYDSPAILGDITNIYIFSLIGFFILVIACINFINLTTAGSLKRTREIGLRKVVGANRKQLIMQFLGETIFLTSLAFIISLVMLELVMSSFNKLVGMYISVNFTDWKILAGTVLILLFTGLFSGIYPAFFLSAFKPIRTLKGTVKFGSKGNILRKSLIVFQFFLSVTLIICTLVVFKQLIYIQNKNLGFNTDHVVCIQCRPGMYRNYPRFKENLLKYSAIVNVTATGEEHGPIPITPGTINWSGKDPQSNPNISLSEVDFGYFQTLQIDLLEGRGFNRDFSSDSTAVVVNEAAVYAMGMQEPLGQQLTLDGQNYTIIGVNKNMHRNSLHTAIEPVVTRIITYVPFTLFIRVDARNLSENIKIIEQEWYRIVPDFPFVYNFLDERIAALYKYEQKIARVFTYFALLAIFISCLGLLGLATFSTESRTKEIGVRKVLGSSAGEIVLLLSRDFAKWVLLGTLIAWPAAWYGMTKWLQTFAYKTRMDLWLFAVSGCFALLLAIITVSFQTIKTAVANPVKALKYE